MGKIILVTGGARSGTRFKSGRTLGVIRNVFASRNVTVERTDFNGG